jgi:hypothetical protein
MIPEASFNSYILFTLKSLLLQILNPEEQNTNNGNVFQKLEALLNYLALQSRLDTELLSLYLLCRDWIVASNKVIEAEKAYDEIMNTAKDAEEAQIADSIVKIKKALNLNNAAVMTLDVITCKLQDAISSKQCV